MHKCLCWFHKGQKLVFISCFRRFYLACFKLKWSHKWAIGAPSELLDPLNHHVEVEIDKGVNTNSLRAKCLLNDLSTLECLLIQFFLVKIKFVTSLRHINTCLFE